MALETLRGLFCGCCGGTRARKDEAANKNHPHHLLPDENSLLIPRDEEPVVSYTDQEYIDQQKLQERLGTIVRAKEGKMVNLGSHIPFNLHNQTLLPSDRTISRSTSGSLDMMNNRYHSSSDHHLDHHHRNGGGGRRGYANPYDRAYHHDDHDHDQHYDERQHYDPYARRSHHHHHNHGHSRSPSDSRSRSPGRHHGDEDDSSRSSRYRITVTERPKPNPILNVRLVGYTGPTMSRGRARERATSSAGAKPPKEREQPQQGEAGSSTQPGTGETPVPRKPKKPIEIDDASSIVMSWGD